MKRTWEFWTKNWFEVIWLTCFGAGALVMADAVWNMGWSQKALLFLVPVIILLLCWSGEKHLRIQVWGGLGQLHLMAGIFLYRRRADMMPFYGMLELEAVCLAACLILWLMWKNRTAFYLASLLQLAALFLAVFQRAEVPGWALCLLLLCQLLFFTELGQRKGGEKSRQTAGHLLPVFAGAVLILGLLPVQEQPIQWETLKKALRAAGEKLEDMSFSARFFFADDSAYSLTFAGYGSDGKLGGSLFSSDQLQISIEGKKTNAPLYLAGTIYDTYTGAGWERKLTDKPYGGTEYLLHHKETVLALANSTFSREEQERMTEYRTCEVRYEGLKTASIFLAPVTNLVRMKPGMSLSEEKADSPVLFKPQTVGFSYELKYMELDYASENMKKLLRQEVWAAEPEPDQSMKAREAFIRENYVSLPESLPTRVRTLADEITEGAKTDYDRMKAIEEWLSAYAYSTAPAECPAGQDFTDFFLFESDSGYCTYFATAMAVLGRCSGIPTRYAEGFVSAKTREGKEKTLNLTGGDAHAWVEAYIEHVGWVPFDPTPGYREISNTPWNLPQKAAVSANSAGSTGAGKAQEEGPEEAQSLWTEEEEKLSALEGGKKAAGILLEIIGVVAAILLLTIGMTAVKKQFRRKKYLASSDYEKIRGMMKKVLEIGELYGFVMQQGETLGAFCGRTEGKLDVVAPLPEGPVRGDSVWETILFAQICDLFLHARFGQGASEGDVKRMQRYVSALEKKYLKECGRMQGLLYRLR